MELPTQATSARSRKVFPGIPWAKPRSERFGPREFFCAIFLRRTCNLGNTQEANPHLASLLCKYYSLPAGYFQYSLAMNILKLLLDEWNGASAVSVIKITRAKMLKSHAWEPLE